MPRRPLAGALLAALVAAALSVDTRVGTHRYDTDFGTNEGGWQPPDHGTTGFQIWTLDQDFEKCALPPPPPRFHARALPWPATHARSPPRADVMKDKTCWLVLFTSWNHDLTDPNDDAWKPYYALAMDRGLEMKIGKLNVEEQPEVAAEFNVTRAEACGKRPTPKWNLEGYCDEVVVPLPRVVLVHRWGARPRGALPPAHTARALTPCRRWQGDTRASCTPRTRRWSWRR